MSPIYNDTFFIDPMRSISPPSALVKRFEPRMSGVIDLSKSHASTNPFVMNELDAPSSFKAVIRLFPRTISIKKWSVER